MLYRFALFFQFTIPVMLRFLLTSVFASVVLAVSAAGYGACAISDSAVVGENINSSFPMHSVMKFVQALYVADKCDLSATIEVDKASLLQDTWSPMLSTFEGKHRFSVRRLLSLSLQQSDNNACDILFASCGAPSDVEAYLRSLGFDDIKLRHTEREMHYNPSLSADNSATPLAMAQLLRWFFVHHLDNANFMEVWDMLAACTTGSDRLPAAFPDARVVAHKTGTGFPHPDGSADANDAGIVLLPGAAPLAVAVFVPAGAGVSVADAARTLLRQL